MSSRVETANLLTTYRSIHLNKMTNDATMPSTQSSPTQLTSSPALNPTSKPFTFSQTSVQASISDDDDDVAFPPLRPSSTTATLKPTTDKHQPPSKKKAPTKPLTAESAKAPHFVPRSSNPATPTSTPTEDRPAMMPHAASTPASFHDHGHVARVAVKPRQKKRQKRATPTTPQNEREEETGDEVEEWTDDEEFIPALVKGRE